MREGIARELGEDFVRLKRPTFSTISDFGLSALGERFDFVMAQSIFSHTFRDLALQGLTGVRDCLADEGLLFATFNEHAEPTGDEGSGWIYPGARGSRGTSSARSAHRPGWRCGCCNGTTRGSGGLSPRVTTPRPNGPRRASRRQTARPARPRQALLALGAEGARVEVAAPETGVCLTFTLKLRLRPRSSRS